MERFLVLIVVKRMPSKAYCRVVRMPPGPRTWGPGSMFTWMQVRQRDTLYDT